MKIGLGLDLTATVGEAASGDEPPTLTFSTGLTRVSNTITANLSTGIAGSQSVIGGTAASETLTLSSTAHATKGKILFGTSAYDEVNNYLGVGTASPSSPFTNAANSIVSVPANRSTGTWYSGGSATTTKPHFLIEPTGATSTGWSANGTGIGVNAASGFTGNLADLQINGASQFKVSYIGDITAGNSFLLAGGATYFQASGTSVVTSGTFAPFQLNRSFAPTSGTAVFNAFSIAGTINQTGGANGIVRGLYFNPTVTAAADLRAIEVTAGTINVSKTITAPATTGNQTINKLAGTVNIAAAGTTVTVTNSLVTANSIIMCTIQTNDTTAVIKNAVPSAGSFVINLNAAATAETAVSFFIIN